LKKYTVVILFVFLFNSITAQQWDIQEKQNMPMKIANNAVTEASVSGNPYVYSFGGIDSTKLYSGITNKSFKYDVIADSWDTVPDLPDTNTKIAAAASFVNGKIYIIGGYIVFSNGSEVSSVKIHRFDPIADTFLTDGVDIPIAIDDHVQAVYKDSLIFVVTGWSNTSNVANVQIYDTYLDSWSTGTQVPTTSYQVFGSTGIIVGDTLYYYGGARSTSNFPASNQLRKGYINPIDPTQITWQTSILSRFITVYRPACTKIDGTVLWVGGSETSYNFDGIAYNGSGGVPISNRIISYNTRKDTFYTHMPSMDSIPMDLRGIASISDSVKYIVEGMSGKQKVSNKTFKLEYKLTTSLKENQNVVSIVVAPNPFGERLELSFKEYKRGRIEIFNASGQLIVQIEKKNQARIAINTSSWEKGIYYLRYSFQDSQGMQKVLKL